MNQIDFKQPTIDSREVAEMVSKEHDQLMRSIRNYSNYLRSAKMQSEKFFIESSYINSRHQTQPCYLLTKMGCEMVANKMTGQKGVLFTAAYVQKFNQMEQTQVFGGFQIPHSLPDALRLAADLSEQKEAERIAKEEAQEQLKLQKPKVLFADSVSESNSTILIGALAKILKQNGVNIGQNRLFQWMRDNGYLIRQRGANYNLPTQRSMELGLFSIKEGTYVHSNGYTEITRTAKVTGKGQVYFVNKFLKDGVANAQK